MVWFESATAVYDRRSPLFSTFYRADRTHLSIPAPLVCTGHHNVNIQVHPSTLVDHVAQYEYPQASQQPAGSAQPPQPPIQPTSPIQHSSSSSFPPAVCAVSTPTPPSPCGYSNCATWSTSIDGWTCMRTRPGHGGGSTNKRRGDR